MAEQQPASDLIEQAAGKIEGIFSGRYTLGTNLGTALRGELRALVEMELAQVHYLYGRQIQENQRMQAILANLAARNVIQPAGQMWAVPWCGCCDAGTEGMDETPDSHEPDCPWIAARALLAEQTVRGQTDTRNEVQP